MRGCCFPKQYILFAFLQLPSPLLHTTRLQLQEQVKDNDIEYVSPPVGEFGVLDWHKLDILNDLGYSIAKTHVNGWFEDWKSRKVRCRTMGRRLLSCCLPSVPAAARLTERLPPDRIARLASPSSQHREEEVMTPSFASPRKLRFNSLTEFDLTEPHSGQRKEWLKLLKERTGDSQRVIPRVSSIGARLWK